MHRLSVRIGYSHTGERLYIVRCSCHRYIAPKYHSWQAREAARAHIQDTMDIRLSEAFERQLANVTDDTIRPTEIVTVTRIAALMETLGMTGDTARTVETEQ